MSASSDADITDLDAMFEAACLRLFALHAGGYKRPRSTSRRAVRPATRHQSERVAPTQRRTTVI